MSDTRSSADAERAAELEPLLRYLGELGYGDLYLRRDEAGDRPVVASPDARGERSTAALADAADATEPLRALAAEAAGCVRCGLAAGRTQVVFGTGAASADLMFIGEGPGYHEDRRGEPFVGAAGQLLDRIIAAIGMRRDEVYIANVVKCRPPNNRDPKPDEVAACRDWLERQVALVRPRVIVALGRVAAQTLLGNDLPLGRMRGQWYELFGARLRVTYHPAALLRNPGLKRPTWEDMQLVRDALREA